MAEVATDDLADRLRKALRDESLPLWFPGLTADLAAVAWRRLFDELGLTPNAYGTARVLRRDSKEMRRVAASISFPSAEGALLDTIPLELLSEDLASQCACPGVRFLNSEEVMGTTVTTCIEGALKLLTVVSDLAPTLCSLIRALHLIDPTDDEVDISFSVPRLPFSVFVSVPSLGAVAGALRVAEALLHEAMHLQLTLVEAILPLVRTKDLLYFSPWRNEYRTAQGVLHAVYVFRVIDEAFTAVALEDLLTPSSKSHLRERRKTIASQLRQVQGFRDCPDLTSDGAAFVNRLFD